VSELGVLPWGPTQPGAELTPVLRGSLEVGVNLNEETER